MVRTSQESARIFTDYTVKAQELNTQLARRAVETWIDGLRKQTELSQEMAQELFGKAEEQADVYRRFFGQWGNFPMGSFPFAGMTNDFMFPFQRQGMRLVETGCQERRGDSSRRLHSRSPVTTRRTSMRSPRGSTV